MKSLLHQILFVLLSLTARNKDRRAVANAQSEIENNRSNNLGDAKSRKYFDAIDKARELLESDSNLAEKIPTCVVVGMQSVGKSAVLSRISGISFPQDGDVCTRVPFELRLRRDEVQPVVIKVGTEAEGIKVEASDEDGIERALRESQKRILDGREFEDTATVKVEKKNPNIPEVTLIDLPGVFFAKSNKADILEELVKNMIEKRVKNEMALILHVVPLNQDTDTLSTWRIVHDADESKTRTVSILTKADLALKDGKGILKRRIKKICSNQDSPDCFIVHGAAKDNETEERELAEISSIIKELGLSNRVKVGIKYLNEFIESRLLEHIKERIPNMRYLLKEELRRCSNTLEKIGREAIPASTIALREFERITANLSRAYNAYMPDFRRLVEEMSHNVSAIQMEPLVDSHYFVRGEAGKQPLEGVGDIDLVIGKLFRGGVEEGEKALPLDIDLVLGKQIEIIGQDTRGIVNEAFGGKSEELKIWLHEFVKPFEKILKQFVKESFDGFYHDVVKPSIERDDNESRAKNQALMKDLEMNIYQKIISEVRDNAVKYADELVMSVRENKYTTNKVIFKKQSELCFKTASQKNSYEKFVSNVHLRTMCGIRSLLESRKIILPDIIQLHFSKLLDDLHKETKKEIGRYLMDDKAMQQLTIEHPQIVSKRKINMEGEEKINAVLDEIKTLFL